MTDIREIDAPALQRLAQSQSVLLIDVRNPGEAPPVPLPHLRIPLPVLSANMPETDAEHIVFICQHGIRSLTAGALGQMHFGGGKQVYSLKGGVVKWLSS